MLLTSHSTQVPATSLASFNTWTTKRIFMYLPLLQLQREECGLFNMLFPKKENYAMHADHL